MTKRQCPECVKEGKQSVVTQGMQSTTLLHIPTQWDVHGNLIDHGNRNKTTTRYSCSEGHSWAETV